MAEANLGGADEVASTPTLEAGEDGNPKKVWAETNNCSVCNAELGKLKLNPRHHCRICGNSVCSSCSPSTVKIEGEKALQRACNPCVTNAALCPVLRDRLIHIGAHLHAIASQGQRAPSAEPPRSIEDAVGYCEASLGAIEDQRDGHEASKTQVQSLKLNYQTQLARTEAAEAAVKTLQEEEDRLQVALDKATRECEISQARGKEWEEKLEASQLREEGLLKDLHLAREVCREAHETGRELADNLRQSQEEHKKLAAEANQIRTELELAQSKATQFEMRLGQEEAVVAKLSDSLRIAEAAAKESERQARSAAEAADVKLMNAKTAQDLAETRVKDAQTSLRELERIVQSHVSLQLTAEERMKSLEVALAAEQDEKRELQRVLEATARERSDGSADEAAPSLRAAQSSILKLAQRLQSLGGCDPSKIAPTAANLDDAILKCELAIPRLEWKIRDLQESTRGMHTALPRSHAGNATPSTTSAVSHTVLSDGLLAGQAEVPRQTCVERYNCVAM